MSKTVTPDKHYSAHKGDVQIYDAFIVVTDSGPALVGRIFDLPKGFSVESASDHGVFVQATDKAYSDAKTMEIAVNKLMNELRGLGQEIKVIPWKRSS